MSGMRALLLSFIICAALFFAWVLIYAAPEVSWLQRIFLGSIPIAVTVLITWLAWKDA